MRSRKERLHALAQATRACFEGFEGSCLSRILFMADALWTVRLIIAECLETPINDTARAMPHRAASAKKDVDRWVNTGLRATGLAIRDPLTERPCLLASEPGDTPDKGCFLLEYVDAKGRRHHSRTSITLPIFKLIPADLSQSKGEPAESGVARRATRPSGAAEKDER